MTQTSRKCSLCGKEKAAAEMARNPMYRDGIDNRCRSCEAVRAKLRRRAAARVSSETRVGTD